MTTPSAHRRFLAWLDHQAGEPGDLGALARAHFAGDVDLAWPDFRDQPTFVAAAATLAREKFAALDAAGVIRSDGTLDEAAARRKVGA